VACSLVTGTFLLNNLASKLIHLDAAQEMYLHVADHVKAQIRHPLLL